MAWRQPDEIKPKIFKPLMTKSKEPVLGLALVKRDVEAQGGTICFENKVGEGTQFRRSFRKNTK